MMTRRLATIVFAAALTTPCLRAQSAPPGDTVTAQVLASAVFSAVASEAANAALDQRLRALHLELPHGASWDKVGAHLHTVLRGRPRIATDKTELVVHLGDIRFSEDTLSAQLTVGVRWQCGSSWIGSGSSYSVTAIRRGQNWQPPVLSGEIAYDSAPCR